MSDGYFSLQRVAIQYCEIIAFQKQRMFFNQQNNRTNSKSAQMYEVKSLIV
jgi:hypothetical protein